MLQILGFLTRRQAASVLGVTHIHCLPRYFGKMWHHFESHWAPSFDSTRALRSDASRQEAAEKRRARSSNPNMQRVNALAAKNGAAWGHAGDSPEKKEKMGNNKKIKRAV